MSILEFVKPLVPKPIRAALRKYQTALQGGYNQIHVERAWSFVNARRPKVLVVGANRGGDCERFLKLGAAEVHGLDVVEDVGADFQHRKAVYHRASIERCDLESNSFDLVFATATMEHVPDIEAGFAEMARLTHPGGAIFSIAAPLWRSPYGHHMGCFHGHPWVHLVYSRDEIIEYAKQHGIDGERGHSIEAIVDYMLDDRFFNKRPSLDYVRAVDSLRGIEIVTNSLDKHPPELLSHHPLGDRALQRGFTTPDLLSVTHTFVGRKH